MGDDLIPLCSSYQSDGEKIQDGDKTGPRTSRAGMLGKLEAGAQRDSWFYLTATLARGVLGFRTSVPQTSCSRFSVVHTFPHKIKSQDKYIHTVPSQSSSVLSECSGEGNGAGSQFSLCIYLAGTFIKAYIFIRVSFLTQVHKLQLWKLPSSAMTKHSTPGQFSDLEVDATLTDVRSLFSPW